MEKPACLLLRSCHFATAKPDHRGISTQTKTPVPRKSTKGSEVKDVQAHQIQAPKQNDSDNTASLLLSQGFRAMAFHRQARLPATWRKPQLTPKLSATARNELPFIDLARLGIAALNLRPLLFLCLPAALLLSACDQAPAPRTGPAPGQTLYRGRPGRGAPARIPRAPEGHRGGRAVVPYRRPAEDPQRAAGTAGETRSADCQPG